MAAVVAAMAAEAAGKGGRRVRSLSARSLDATDYG